MFNRNFKEIKMNKVKIIIKNSKKENELIRMNKKYKQIKSKKWKCCKLKLIRINEKFK